MHHYVFTSFQINHLEVLQGTRVPNMLVSSSIHSKLLPPIPRPNVSLPPVLPIRFRACSDRRCPRPFWGETKLANFWIDWVKANYITSAEVCAQRCRKNKSQFLRSKGLVCVSNLGTDGFPNLPWPSYFASFCVSLLLSALRRNFDVGCYSAGGFTPEEHFETYEKPASPLLPSCSPFYGGFQLP